MYFAYFTLLRGDGVVKRITEIITEEQRIDIIRQINKSGKAYSESKNEYYEILEMYVVKMDKII